uniref:Uncharacterized protein n=1 Tax=Physcomitrium patens TaxID=3218 RepID=A0A2K1IR87_PHYPA|nr:hypothetical protein PHYPA_025915 [Physcomitrium patens]
MIATNGTRANQAIITLDDVDGANITRCSTHRQNGGTIQFLPSWKPYILAYKIPRRLRKRNDAIFNELYWPPQKMGNRVWLNLVDYDRVAWARTLKLCKNTPRNRTQLIDKFKQQWCGNAVLAK